MTLYRIILIFTLLVIFACTINEPNIPEWDTAIKIHFPTQDVLMEKLINDSTLVGANDNGTPIILVQLEDSSDWERISQDDLVLEEQNDHYNSEVGDINLGNYEDLNSDSVSVMDVLIPELFATGDTLLPYDSMTVYPGGSVVEYTDYRSANIKEGQLWLTFHNDMFVNIRKGLIISVYNENGTSRLIQDVVFDEPIPAGTSKVSDPINLSNQYIYNKFRLEYTIPVEGSDAPKVLTPEDRSGFFYTTLSVDEFVVDYAEALVPEQTFESSDSIDISDQDHQIIDARIAQGTITFQIQNKLPLDTEVQLELPNFRENGEIKKITHHLLADQDDELKINIAGWEVTNYKNPGSIIPAIDYNVFATVDSTDDFVTIHSTDSILIDVKTDSFYVSSFTGVLDTVSFDVDPVELDDIDIFDDIDGEIRLNDLEMSLDFYNEIDLPIDVNLKITGIHQDPNNPAQSDSVIIYLSEQVQPSSVSDKTTIVLDENYTEPSIVDLLEILPTEISISGDAKVFGEGSVSVDDGLRVLYKLESPLNFEISQPVYFDVAIDSITNDDLDQDTRDKLVNDVANVNTSFIFINHTPIGASVKYYIAADSMMLYNDEIPDSSKKIILETDISAGLTGSDGYVTNPNTENSLDIHLTDTQLDIFNFSPLYTRQELILKPTDGFVKVRQTDRIDIEAVMDAEFTVNSQDE